MNGWAKAIDWYENQVKWKPTVRSKHEKLEEAEGVWEYFKETFSESDATILEALMNQDATDSQGNQKVLDEAFKSLK